MRKKLLKKAKRNYQYPFLGVVVFEKSEPKPNKIVKSRFYREHFERQLASY